MTTNNYFKNFNSFPQQELLNDLTKEVIQMSGMDVLYVIRKDINKDELLNEDTAKIYSNTRQVEMYLNTPEGFGGTGEVVTKFGFDIVDEVSFIVNKERFISEVGIATPREGDLIYLPINKGLFEIKFVEHEKPFYSLGKNTVYELSCELFMYNNEIFDIPDIESGEIFNKIEREKAVTTRFTLSSTNLYKVGEKIFQGASLSASTATAKVAAQDGLNLDVYHVAGTFKLNEAIVGVKSTSSNLLSSIDDQEIATSKYDDNKLLETEGDSILDFTEIDPWSEGDV